MELIAAMWKQQKKSNIGIYYKQYINLWIMASIPLGQLSEVDKQQLAASYAVFVLSGQGATITADKIKAVLSAAGINVNANLIKTFAKTFATRNVKDFIGGVGGTGSGSAGTEVKEEKKKDDKKDGKDDKKDKKDDKKDDKKGDKGAKAVSAPPPPPPPPPPPADDDEMDVGGLFG